MRPVAVTGATGFLGRHIVRALQSAGHTVRAVVRSPDKAADLAAAGVEVAAADLSDPVALVQAFSGASAVVSNAALGSWLGTIQDYRRVNVQGTTHLLDAMQQTGVHRLVHISSVAVGRTRLGRWADEQVERYGRAGRRGPWQPSDLTTDWRYALTKSESEQLVRQRMPQIHATILRPGPIFGPGDPKLSRKYLRMWRRSVCFAPTARVPHVCATDVAAAVASALVRPVSIGRTYTLTGAPVSPYDIVRCLVRVTGRGPVVVPVPVPTWVGFVNHRATRDLGFVSRPLDETVGAILRHEGMVGSGVETRAG